MGRLNLSGSAVRKRFKSLNIEKALISTGGKGALPFWSHIKQQDFSKTFTYLTFFKKKHQRKHLKAKNQRPL